MFQGMEDSQFQSSSLPGFSAAGASPGRPASPLNGDRHLDVPQTHEQLIAHNSSLKTRVSELEVINELFRSRLTQLEQDEANARRGQEISGQAEAQLRAQVDSLTKSEGQLRTQLDDSHRRENNLKRRLDELELELKDAKDSIDSGDSQRLAKKLRVSDMVGDSDVSTPQSAA
jgi:GATA-binding protein, other eukaryote